MVTNYSFDISRPIYFKRNSAQHLEDLICTNKLEGHLFQKKKVFSATRGFFHDWKTTNLGAIFFPQKLVLSQYTFFQGLLTNFDIKLKRCFKNLFKKTVKKMMILLF